jgi:hypothetical protein
VENISVIVNASVVAISTTRRQCAPSPLVGEGWGEGFYR